MERLRQLVASRGNGFRLSEPFCGGVAFATDCHRLQPLGSIRAPSSVASSGYGGVHTGTSMRQWPTRNAYGPRSTLSMDAVEDGHFEVGVQLLLAREELIEERVTFAPARRAMR
jgi:hypothetical protein